MWTSSHNDVAAVLGSRTNSCMTRRLFFEPSALPDNVYNGGAVFIHKQVIGVVSDAFENVADFVGFGHLVSTCRHKAKTPCMYMMYGSVEVFGLARKFLLGGSVLGPLFLVYINDIHLYVEPPIQNKLFADDCAIYAAINNEHQI